MHRTSSGTGTKPAHRTPTHRTARRRPARPTRPAARIVIADGHPMFAQGLRALLDDRYQVVAMVHDGVGTVKAVRESRPDLLLLDLALPGRTGLDVLRDLGAVQTSVRILVISMHRHPVLVDTAMRLGASGFVPKSADVAELREAMEEVLAGRRYRSALLPGHARSALVRERMGFDRLTSRQQDIVRLIGRGFRTEDIARQLRISVHTVNFHRKNIRQQLGCDGGWAMLRLAILAELSEDNRCVVGGRLACITAAHSRPPAASRSVSA